MSTEPTQLTETDILRWLRNRAAETGLDGICLSVWSDDFAPMRVMYKGEFGNGNTFDEAINRALANVKSPQQVVADLEEQLAAARGVLNAEQAKKGLAA
jgi:hypothetical protein